MSTTTTTPYMSLALPIPTVELGPQWAVDLNNALALVDSHTHVPGQGVPVPTAGLNINADLSFTGFNALNLRSIKMQSQTSALSGVSDVKCLYVNNGDLWYNSASGAQVAITSGSAINFSGFGGISGLGATSAALTYSSISKVFTFTQNTGVTADISCGALSLSQDVSSANSVTVKSPNSLASSYALTLPNALPAATNFVTLDSSGNIAGSIPTNAGLTTTNLSASAGILGTQLSAAANIVGTQLYAAAGITPAQLDSMTVPYWAISSSTSGSFSSTSATIVTVTNLSSVIIPGAVQTSSRPVFVFFDGGYVGVSTTSGTPVTATFEVRVSNGSTFATVAIFTMRLDGNFTTTQSVPCGALNCVDLTRHGFVYSLGVFVTAGGTAFVNGVEMKVVQV